MVTSYQGLNFIETWNKIYKRYLKKIAFYVHQGEITLQNEVAKVLKNPASNDFTIQVNPNRCYILYVFHIKFFKTP